MRENWFLKIDGIAGESTDARHAGEIEVQAWSWGLSNTGGGGTGSGGGAGKASFQDFQFTTHVSSASPPLFLACATGRHIKSATLTGVRAGTGKGVEFLRYALSDVVVGSVQHADASGEAPLESFALSAARIELTYVPQTKTGAAGTPVTAVFDVKTGR